MKQKTQQRKLLTEISGFKVESDDTYFLNSSEIKTVDYLLTHGQDYLLYYDHPKKGMKYMSVKFITARNRHDGWVEIHLENNQRPEKLTLSIPFIPGERRPFPFILMDVSSLVMELNIRLMQKANYNTDNRSSTFEKKESNYILDIIHDEIYDKMKFNELLNFEF